MPDHYKRGGGPGAFGKVKTRPVTKDSTPVSVTPSDRYQKRSRNPSGAPATKQDHDPRDMMDFGFSLDEA